MTGCISASPEYARFPHRSRAKTTAGRHQVENVLGVANALMGRRMLRAKEAANIVPMVRRLEHAGGTDKRLDGRDVCFASPHPRHAYL
jgi:hypothetical protein